MRRPKNKAPQTTRLHRIKELKQQSIENPNQLDIQAIYSIQIQTIRGGAKISIQEKCEPILSFYS